MVHLHLSLSQLEVLGELHPLGDGQVLVLLELGLERLDLCRRESGARSLLAVVVIAGRVVCAMGKT